MQTRIEAPEQGAEVKAAAVKKRPAGRLRRAVLRFPADLLERCDRLAASASIVRGTCVSRAAVQRALLVGGLAEAEGDAAFGSKMDAAILRRGRKSRRSALELVAASKGSK